MRTPAPMPVPTPVPSPMPAHAHVALLVPSPASKAGVKYVEINDFWRTLYNPLAYELTPESYERAMKKKVPILLIIQKSF